MPWDVLLLAQLLSCDKQKSSAESDHDASVEIEPMDCTIRVVAVTKPNHESRNAMTSLRCRMRSVLICVLDHEHRAS